MAETLEIDYKPQPKQLLLSECPANEILFGGSAGPGKVALNNAKILTPYGWKLGKDLVVGETICGFDGKPQKIIAISPPITDIGWDVELYDGGKTTVMAGHLWKYSLNGWEWEVDSTEKIRGLLKLYGWVYLPACDKIKLADGLIVGPGRGSGYRHISRIRERADLPLVTGRCITVSNPDGLYITDDFIVTHNSHAIRYEALIWAMRIPKLQVYLFRRIYPELERNHILPILMEWGNKYGEYSDRKRRYVLSNGSIIHFCHAQYEQDIMGYHGAEIHLLIVDELSTFTEFQYTYLRNRVRCALELPEQYIGKVPGIICGSNPGGPGHEFCKSMFVDFCTIDTEEAVKRMREPELYGPVYEHPHRRLGHTIYYGLRKAPDEEGGMVRAYIPALLEDNPILMERDPGYINRVKAMPEPYRSAYLDGDWEIFVGQMFNFSRKHHVCPKHEVPAHAPIYFGFDWGFGKPFSCNWFYTDADGRLYLFSEWYGFTGVPDTGLRMSDSQIAEGIIKHEKLIGLRTETGGIVVNGFDCGVQIRPVEYILSPDCFSRKPSYMGGGQGPSTDEVFAMYGINGYPGDATRNQKIKQFHERLRIPENGDRPMFQVFETCPQFIRTIPQLQQSQTDPEDVDGKAEDHIYDAVSLVFMSRPVELKMPNEKLSPTDLRLERLKAMGGDPYEDYAGYHAEVEMNRLDGEDFGDDLVDTVF